MKFLNLPVTYIGDLVRVAAADPVVILALEMDEAVHDRSRSYLAGNITLTEISLNLCCV
jgi:hypothetical protein